VIRSRSTSRERKVMAEKPKGTTLSLDIGEGLRMNPRSPEERTPIERGRSISPTQKRGRSPDRERSSKRFR
jgi:hypothetical protein